MMDTVGASYSTRCELSASPPEDTLGRASAQAQHLDNTSFLGGCVSS